MLRLSNLHRSRKRQQQLVVGELANLFHGERLCVIGGPIDDVFVALAFIEHVARRAGVDSDFFFVAPHAVHAASIALAREVAANFFGGGPN
jgi:hypothetical protein